MTGTVTIFLAILTVVGQVLALALFIELIRIRKGERSHLLSLVGYNALVLALFVSGVATLGSLFFSEIAHYEPCKFCWLQRIFMYPLVVIFGMALWRQDRGVFPYALALSSIGALLAAYHYVMQIGLIEPTTCNAVGVGISCSDVFTMTFGYITIPMMAFTAFVLLILTSTIARRS